MTTNSKNDLPLYRVSFSRITGQDEQGKDVLGRPKEIGAAWSRKGDKHGAIINLDIIPTDLVNRNGVLFLVPVTSADVASADLKRCHFFNGIKTETSGRDATRLFDLSADADPLENILQDNPEIIMMIIDPVSAYQGKTDSPTIPIYGRFLLRIKRWLLSMVWLLFL